MASQHNSIGYIVIEGSEGQIRGAALVTDARGVPVDFVYTAPIRPPRLERVLFGNSLIQHVKEGLALTSLLEAVEIEPQIWICNDNDLLEPLKSTGKVDAVLLSETVQTPLEAAGHIETTSEPGVFLLQLTSNGSPVRAEFPDNTRSDDIDAISRILFDAADTMDILEPFTRIQKAFPLLTAGTE